MTSSIAPVRRPLAALGLLAILGAALAGCGGGSSQNSSTGPTVAGTSQASGASASPGSAVCADLASLESSWHALQQASPGTGGLADVTAQLSAMRDDLARLRTDAAAQYSSQIDAVTKAASALADDLRGVASTSPSASPSAGTLSGIATDVQALGTAVRNLVSTIQPHC